jgi:hypothetical protein
MTSETPSIERPKRRKPKIACPLCRLHGTELENGTPTGFNATVTVYNKRSRAIARARGRLCSECKDLLDWELLEVRAAEAEEHATDMEMEADDLQEKAEAAYLFAEKAKRGDSLGPYIKRCQAWGDAQQDADDAKEEADEAQAEADRVRTEARHYDKAPPNCHDDSLTVTVRGRKGRRL